MTAIEMHRIDEVLNATDELIAFIVDDCQRIGSDDELMAMLMRLRHEHAAFARVIDKCYRQTSDYSVFF
jgi:hypothetical protein